MAEVKKIKSNENTKAPTDMNKSISGGSIALGSQDAPASTGASITPGQKRPKSN